MINNPVSSRRLAERLLAVQAMAAFAVALACIPWGWRHMASALAGGLLVVVGTTLLAVRSLSGGVPALALMRMLTGVLLRWIVVLGGVFLVLVRLEWPPAPLVAGLAAALLAPLLLRFKQ